MLTTLLPAAGDPVVLTTGQIFWSEFLGTAVLLLLGGGVVATNLLPKSKGKGGGWLLINWGWGLAVFAGVYVAVRSGGHLNPAVTIAKAVGHAFDSLSDPLGNSFACSAAGQDWYRCGRPGCPGWNRRDRGPVSRGGQAS